MTDRPAERLVTLPQPDAFTSPYSARHKRRQAAWDVCRVLLFLPSPKPWIGWRLWLLKRFGARIDGRPFVASSAIIKMPWNLVLRDRSCLGPGCEVYNLGEIEIGERCTVAQHVYLCGGTHDLSTPALPLVTGPIRIGADAFVGVRALVLPGVIIGEGAVIGAGSVVTRDVPPWQIVAGNPARPIKRREWRGVKDPQTDAEETVL